MRSGRATSVALPAKKRPRRARREADAGADDRSTPDRLVCDVCGRARTRDERHRLVWEFDPATTLVLAELCRSCAAVYDPFLELYGGRGRDAIRLVQEVRAAPPKTAQRRVLGVTTRGILYLLIAVASFLLVTLVTSRGR